MAFLFTSVASQIVKNTTTETTLVPPGNGTVVIPASALQPSNIIRVTAKGKWNTDAVLAPTLHIRLKFVGGVTVTLLDSGALTCVLTATSRNWALDAFLVCLNSGAAAAIASRGHIRFNSTTTISVTWDLGGGSANTIDSTVDQTLNVTAQWGTADVDNEIVCDVFAVEVSGA
jgi:hypothetical protein